MAILYSLPQVLPEATGNFDDLIDGLPGEVEPERMLYQLLRDEGGDAYSRYNALLRELSSFLNGLDRRLRLRAEAAAAGGAALLG